MKKWKECLANDLLDLIVDINGASWTIEWLLESGYTKEQLVTLLFAPQDIEDVKAGMKKEREGE